jgi:outer membrane protein assembly factor BamE (lipoprotein component of BamABCDE complex)
MRQSLALFLVAGLLLTAPACTRMRDMKGYVTDDQLITSLQTGVDNRASVQKMLGRPTVISSTDPNIWYYVSQRTEQFAFMLPRPKDHQVLVVRFDAKGNLGKVERLTGREIVNVSPSGDKTPTLGKEVGLWSELFGDVGRYSAVDDKDPN